MHKMVPYAVYVPTLNMESVLNSDQTAVFDVCATRWKGYLAAVNGYSRPAGKANKTALPFPQRRRAGECSFEDRS